LDPSGLPFCGTDSRLNSKIILWFSISIGVFRWADVSEPWSCGLWSGATAWRGYRNTSENIVVWRSTSRNWC